MQKGSKLCPAQKQYYNNKIRFLMRCSIIILAIQLTLSGVLLAGNLSGQDLNKKVSLHIGRVGIRESLLAIERQSGIHFLLRDDLLAGKTSTVPVSSASLSVKEAIEKVLAGTGLYYTVEQGFVLIKQRPVIQEEATVSGVVTDAETDELLIGATVQIGNKRSSTDINGRYSISLSKGIYYGDASYIGYELKTTAGIVLGAGQKLILNFRIKKQQGELNEVTVKADRVITSTDAQVLNTLKAATGVVSGISSEQISISVDRSATEVIRRVSGVTLQDGFISVRGMSPRYNPVYLNNAYLPSTDPNKRAFNFDLLPSNVIDRILVYKSAAPELPADFAGGVIKVYTKRSVAIRRTEFSINGQYRTGNKFFGNYAQAGGGKYDWLGYDDGQRSFPLNVPRNSFGEVQIPLLPNVADNYTKTNEIITRALLQRSAHSWNINQRYYPMDLLADLTHYDYADLGKAKLSSVTIARYERQGTYINSPTARRANRYVETEFPANGAPLTPYYDTDYRSSVDSIYQTNVRIAAMQNLSLAIGKDHDISFMGMYNHSTKDVLQINTLQEFMVSQRASLYPRRFESSYNTQDLLLGQLSGTHKIGKGRHSIEWNANHSYASLNDPNQFSNVYDIDNGSIITKDNLESGGFGRINITPATRWKLNNVTSFGTTIGRFYDGKGDEKRWQGSLDYKLIPIRKWSELYLRAGAYFEDRSKVYRMSTLAFKDYPVTPFEENPWEHTGNQILDLQMQPGVTPMHTQVQDAGTGAQTYGYTASFKNVAGYLSANLPLHLGTMKLDIYGGVRYEYSERKVFTTKGLEIREETNLDGSGKTVITAVAADPYQKFLLPSVSAALHVTRNQQVRFAYGKTLNRPDLRELSPFVTYNPSDGFTYIGKPTLHDSHINNIDLRWEWYPSADEMISAGVYYKYINEPIEEIQKNLNVGVNGFSTGNMVYARIRGAEIDIRKKLDFIGGGIFNNLGLIVNASLNLTQTNN